MRNCAPSARAAWLRWRSLATEFGWVSAAQVLGMLGGLITLKVLTQLLPVSEFGLFTIGLSSALAIVAFLYDPLGKTALRFAADTSSVQGSPPQLGPEHSSHTGETYPDDLPALEIPPTIAGDRRDRLTPGFLQAFRRLHVRAAIAVLAATLAGLGITAIYFGPGFGAVVLATALLAVAQGLFANATLVAVSLRKRQLVAATQALLGLLRPLCAALFVLAAASTAVWALAGQAVAFAGVCAILVWVLSRQVARWQSAPASSEFSSRGRNGVGISAMSSYFYGLLAAAGIGVFSLYSDRWLAAAFLDLESAGLYGAIALLASGPLFALNGIVYRFAAPFAFAVQNGDEGALPSRVRVTVRSALVLWAGFVVPLFALCIVCHEWIVTLTTSEAYAANSLLLPVLVFGIGVERAGNILTLIGQYAYETRPYVWTRLIHAVSLITVSLMLIPAYGIAALAYAHAIAGAIYIAVVLYCNKLLTGSAAPQARRE